MAFARGVLLVLVCVLPWWFAGVQPLPQLLLAIGLLLAALAIVPRLGEAAEAWRSTWCVLLCLGLGVGLGAAQLSERVGELIARVDPHWTSVPRLYASELPFTEPRPGPVAESVRAAQIAQTSSLPTRPISLDSAATRRSLATLVCAAVAFALGAVCFSEQRAMLRLLIASSGVAAAVAFFGLVQRLSWNGLVYWSISPVGGQPFGPFINRNNGGGFLEIGFAAALGLMIWQLQKIPVFQDDARRDQSLPWRTRPSISRRCAWILAHLSTPLLASGTAVLLIFAGVVASSSRGTFLSVAAAMIVVGGSTSVVRRSTWTIVAAAALVGSAVGLVVWLGQSQSLVDRIVSTLDGGNAPGNEPRLVHWQTALRAVPDYWPCGTGLGAYRYGYARYQRAPTECEYFYAENQYLDALLSAGVGGLGLLLVCLGATFVGVVRLWRRVRTAEEQGIAVAALGMLTAGAIHGCFDFAMYTPACFVPFAVVCGSLMAQAFHRAPEKVAVRSRASVWRLPFAAASLLLMLGGVGWSAMQFYEAHVVREALDASILTDSPDERENVEEVDAAIRSVVQAATLVPDDADLQIKLANLWSDRYTRAFRRELRLTPVDPAYWSLESTWQMHDVAQLLARTADDAGLSALRSYRLIVENLVPAMAAARRARSICPFSARAQLKNAVLCFVDESPRNDAAYLVRAERLAGGFAPWWYDIGLLHLHSGRLDQAFAAWRTCWSLSPRFESQILLLASGYLSTEELLRRLVPPEPATVVRIAETYFKNEAFEYDRKVCGRRAVELLAEVSQPTPAQCHLRAAAERLSGNLREAANWYSQAADREAVNAEWYYDAALAHYELGDFRAARIDLHEAQRRDGGSEKFRKLREQIEAAAVKNESPSNP